MIDGANKTMLRGRPAGRVDEESAGGRLRRLRDERGLTQQGLANRLNVDRSMIARYETGKHVMSPDVIQRAADVFGVRPSFIQFGDEGAQIVPVIAWVAAGDLADVTSQIPEGTETIEISGLEPGDYFATRVSGDSMDRLSPPGSLILVNRAEREPIRGRRYIFSRRGETTYKRFESNPRRLVPESTNPMHEPIFPNSEEEWTVIGRVRMTIFDDM